MSVLRGPHPVVFLMNLFTPGSTWEKETFLCFSKNPYYHHVNFLSVSSHLLFHISEHTLGDVGMHQTAFHIFATHVTFVWVCHLWSYSQHWRATHHCPVFRCAVFYKWDLLICAALHLVPFTWNDISDGFYLLLHVRTSYCQIMFYCVSSLCALIHGPLDGYTLLFTHKLTWVHLTCFTYTCAHCILYSHMYTYILQENINSQTHHWGWEPSPSQGLQVEQPCLHSIWWSNREGWKWLWKKLKPNSIP